MKLNKKLMVALAATSLAFAPMTGLKPLMQSAQAITANQNYLSLGASLNAQEIQQTMALLGANGITPDKTLYIDGNTINAYLNDGSNASTGVFSSAMIQGLPAGSGVQVQIITPQNIQVVKPVTYQNAAITSGASDVLIKIATVKPVTGEGALTGVYALLEEAGVKVDPQAIVVAEKEIQIVEQTKEETSLTDNEINKLILDIKTEVTRLVSSEQGVDGYQVVDMVLANNPTIKVTDNIREVLVQLALDFAKTEVAKRVETLDQLENSINVSNDYPYAVDLAQYGDGLNFGRTDDSEVYTIDPQHSLFKVASTGQTFVLSSQLIQTTEFNIVDETGASRDVKVNTQIDVKTEDGIVVTSYYLFVNTDGGLSLISPEMTYEGQPVNYEYRLQALEQAPSEDETSTSGNQPDTTTSQVVTPEETSLVTEETVASDETTVATEETSQTVLEETSEQTTSDPTSSQTWDTPYAVDLESLEDKTHFKLEGMNIPTEIIYDKVAQTMTLIHPDGQEEVGPVTIYQDPTEEIRLFSEDGTGIRTIQANTFLIVDRENNQAPYEFYLFINKDGKVTLAAPNFAGNVSAEDADVRLEYVLDESTQAQ